MASSGAAVLSRPMTLTMGNITALCKRLEDRANSILAAQDPQVANDMLLAAVVIRQMQAGAYHHSDLLAIPAGTTVPLLA